MTARQAVIEITHISESGINEVRVDNFLKVVTHKLKGDNAALLAALKDLLDEQNDAPLETRRKEWEAAMEKARAAIENAEKTLPLQ